MISSKYLVDIDSLFDTRIGVIAKQSPELAASIMASDAYAIRTKDVFDGVDMEQYQADWTSRDKALLAECNPAHFLPWLNAQLKKDFLDPKFSTPDRVIEVQINSYPYLLEHWEKEEFLDIISSIVTIPITWTMVHIPNNLITPTYLKTNKYTTFACYEGRAWMESIQVALEETPIPDITMILPEMCDDDIDYSEIPSAIREKAKEAGPFAITEMLMAVMINLHYVPMCVYSNVLTSINATGGE